MEPTSVTNDPVERYRRFRARLAELRASGTDVTQQQVVKLRETGSRLQAAAQQAQAATPVEVVVRGGVAPPVEVAPMRAGASPTLPQALPSHDRERTQAAPDLYRRVPPQIDPARMEAFMQNLVPPEVLAAERARRLDAQPSTNVVTAYEQGSRQRELATKLRYLAEGRAFLDADDDYGVPVDRAAMASEVLRIIEQMQQAPQNESLSSASAVLSDPLKNVPELIAQSIGSGPESILGTVALGPLGPVGMGLGGLFGGFSAETANKIGELLQEELDFTDASSLQGSVSVLTPDRLAEIRQKAERRGLAVGSVEAVMALLTAGLAKAPLARPVRVGAELTAETAGEALGEAAGQVAAGETLNMDEIALEAIAGGGQSIATTAVAEALAPGGAPLQEAPTQESEAGSTVEPPPAVVEPPPAPEAVAAREGLEVAPQVRQETGIDLRDDEGQPVTVQSSRYDEVLANHFEDYYESLDEGRVEVPDDAGLEAYYDAVANSSGSPLEVIEAYVQRLAEGSTENDPVAEALSDVGRLRSADFDAVSGSDKRDVGLAWLSPNGASFEQAIEAVRESTGQEITGDDILAYMYANPTRRKSDPMIGRLETRFTEITGQKLRPSTANAVLERLYEPVPSDGIMGDDLSDVPFSRVKGRPLSRNGTVTKRDYQAVENTASAIQKVGGIGNVVVVASADSLPEAVPQAVQEAMRSMGQGNYLSPGVLVDGQVYLVADQLAAAAKAEGVSVAEMTRRTVLHEVVGHQGLKGLLGDDFGPTMHRVFDVLDDAAVRELTGLYADQLSTSDSTQFTSDDKALLAEEYLARIAEGLAVKPSVVKRVLARLRYALRRLLGFDLSDQDLKDLLIRAQGSIRGQASKPAQQENTSDIRFSRRPVAFDKAFARRLKRRVKKDKPIIGRPDLANPGLTPEVRKAIGFVDEMRAEAGVPDKETFAKWQGLADAALATNYDAVKAAILSGATLDNPVAVLAAKKIVADEGAAALASGNEEALAEFGLLIHKYRTARTETARAMAAGRDPLQSPKERAKQMALEAVLEPDPKTRKKLQVAEAKAAQIDEQAALARRALPQAKDRPAAERRVRQLEKRSKAVVQKVVDQHSAKVLRVRDALLAQGIDVSNLTDEQVGDPRIVARIIRTAQAGKSTMGDMAFEYWVNAILSALTTHSANIIGNTLNTTWDFTVQRWVEALVNAVVPGEKADAATLGELKYLYKGVLGSTVQNAWRRSALAWDTESPVFAEEMGFEQVTKLEDYRKAIGGAGGRVVRVPGRLLVASDEFAKSIIWNMQVGAEAYRIAKAEGLRGDSLSKRVHELVSEPQSLAAQRAYAKALELTFQEEGGGGVRALQSARSDYPALRYVVPFVRTPANILKTGVRKSPLGALALIYRGARDGLYRLGLSDNAEMIYSRRRAVRDTAEQVLAWTAFMGIASIVFNQDDDEPILTGSRPSFRESGKRQLQERAVPPTSIKIGDTYYDYGRLEPLSTMLIGMVDGASALKRMEQGAPTSEAAGSFFNTSVAMVRDKSFLMGVGDIIRAVEDGESATRWIGRFASSWSPNIIRSTLRASDDVARDYRVRSEGLSWFAEMGARTKQGALPLSSYAPIAKYDLWGREVKMGVGGPYSDFLWRATVPLRRADTDRITVYDRLIMNWNAQNPAGSIEYENGFYPRLPRPFFTYGRTRIDMTDSEYAEYLRRSGEETVAILEGRTAWNPDPSQPAIKDIVFIDRAIRAGRDRAKALMLKEGVFSKAKTE